MCRSEQQAGCVLQVITYIMPNGVKEVVEERVVKEVVRGMIPPGESDMWEAVALTVPPLVPANVNLTCRLLDVQYRIDVSHAHASLAMGNCCLAHEILQRIHTRTSYVNLKKNLTILNENRTSSI